MQSDHFDIPVVLFIFNRPVTTKRVFEVLRKIRPARLLVVADAPRSNRPDDLALCTAVLDIVSDVNWPCKVSHNIAETNLGCHPRILTGLDWAFSLVEEAILLEDDCVPDPSFFPFCEEMLHRYRGDGRVGAVSGTNLVGKHVAVSTSYYFSVLGGNWGWATWRDEWLQLDRSMATWPELKREGMLQELFANRNTAAYWSAIFDSLYGCTDFCPWDYRWLYTRLTKGKLTIVPRVNLVENTGSGADATHTQDMPKRLRPRVESLGFPLTHPVSFIPSRSLDNRSQELHSTTLSRRFKHKLTRFIRSVSHAKRSIDK